MNTEAWAQEPPCRPRILHGQRLPSWRSARRGCKAFKYSPRACPRSHTVPSFLPRVASAESLSLWTPASLLPLSLSFVASPCSSSLGFLGAWVSWSPSTGTTSSPCGTPFVSYGQKAFYSSGQILLGQQLIRDFCLQAFEKGVASATFLLLPTSNFSPSPFLASSLPVPHPHHEGPCDGAENIPIRGANFMSLVGTLQRCRWKEGSKLACRGSHLRSPAPSIPVWSLQLSPKPTSIIIYKVESTHTLPFCRALWKPGFMQCSKFWCIKKKFKYFPLMWKYF